MNYKFKSLLFLIAFVLSSVIYYASEHASFEELDKTQTQVADIASEEDIPVNDDDTQSYVE